MKLIALFGLIAGGIIAAGQMTAAQWHAAGVTLLALTLAHGLSVLPWLLAAAFARLWWRQRRLTQIWYDGWLEENAVHIQQAATPPQRRKRAAR